MNHESLRESTIKGTISNSQFSNIDRKLRVEPTNDVEPTKPKRLSNGLFASLKKKKKESSPNKTPDRKSNGLFSQLKNDKKKKPVRKTPTMPYDRTSENANIVMPEDLSINSNVFLKQRGEAIGPVKIQQKIK